jgi:hypothetical protein
MNEKEEYEFLKSIYDGAKKHHIIIIPDWLKDLEWLLDKKKEEVRSFIKRKEMEL